MSDPRTPQVEAFLSDVVELCRKHNLSISHEDGEGAFLIEPFDERLVEWFMAAFDETEKRK